jgi:hypothetical protein
MHRMRVCFAVFAFVLAAMQAGVCGARDSDLARIKTIGIVSAMGDQLELANVGSTVFGNKRGTADIADWKLDEEVAATVGRVLTGRYETVVIGGFDKSRFRPTGPGFFGAQIDEEDETRALAQRAGAPAVDAYLLIYPLFNVNPISLNNQWLTGPGLYRESRREAIYALGVATLIDARTFDAIGSKWLCLPTDDRETGSDLPYRRVEGLIPETYEAMTPEQRQKAEAIMKEVLRESVEHTLSRLKLAP